MKSKVMDRPMFKQKEDMDPENVGIMSGFKDMDIDELFESEMKEGEGMYDSSAMLERRPDSPEILMNNLRGDMRSVDARREELADMVGYNAAMETPEEVLALLQGSLGGGIGGLPTGPTAQGPAMPPPMPQDAGMMPPPMPQDMGMMSPGMPAQTPPMEAVGMPPLAMAQGGIVQRFRNGTDGPDEDQDGGVSPAGKGAVSYPPEMVSRAQREMIKFIAQQPRKEPSLRTAMQERVPIYQELLGGGGRDAAQAQMLFDISGAFLGFAANRGPQGETLKGSPFARFAGATRALPGQIGARASDFAKQEQAIQLAALQAGEREVEAARASNIKLIESQRKFYSDVLKAAGKGESPFGKGLKGSAYNILVDLAPSFAMGKTNEVDDRKFEAAIKVVTEPEFFIDELGNRRMRVPELPDFVKNSLAMRNMPVPAQGQLPSLAPPGTSTGEAGAATPATGTSAPTAATSTPVARGEPTLFVAAERGTGIIPVTANWLSKFPFLGNIAPGEQQAVTFVSNSINQLNRAIATNPRFAEGERQQIQRELDLFPKVIDNPEAFRNRLIGLDDLLIRLRREAAEKSVDPSIAVKDQIEARDKVSEVDKIRSLMGVPRRVTSIEDFRQLPIGSTFLYPNSKTGALEVRTKK